MVDVVWALKAVELSGGEKADSSRAIGGAADSAGAIGEAVESSDSEAAVDMNDGEAAVEPGDGETADSSRAIRGGAAAGVKPGVAG